MKNKEISKKIYNQRVINKINNKINGSFAKPHIISSIHIYHKWISKIAFPPSRCK